MRYRDLDVSTIARLIGTRDTDRSSWNTSTHKVSQKVHDIFLIFSSSLTPQIILETKSIYRSSLIGTRDKKCRVESRLTKSLVTVTIFILILSSSVTQKTKETKKNPVVLWFSLPDEKFRTISVFMTSWHDVMKMSWRQGLAWNRLRIFVTMSGPIWTNNEIKNMLVNAKCNICADVI